MKRVVKEVHKQEQIKKSLYPYDVQIFTTNTSKGLRSLKDLTKHLQCLHYIFFKEKQHVVSLPLSLVPCKGNAQEITLGCI